MVDFNRLLSPEDQANLAAYKKTVAECMSRTDQEMVGHAIHILHNAGDPHTHVGFQIRSFVRSYTSALHFVVLPELIRRLAGGVPPQECPACGMWIDWNVMLMGTLTRDADDLVYSCLPEGWPGSTVDKIAQLTALPVHEVGPVLDRLVADGCVIHSKDPRLVSAASCYHRRDAVPFSSVKARLVKTASSVKCTTASAPYTDCAADYISWATDGGRCEYSE